MLINMLADRLQLRFHREHKEMRRYALSVDKGGPKLTPHPGANAADLFIDQTVEKFLHIKLKATAAPMDYLAFRLSLLMDLPVVDLTGLQRGYDFTLEYTRDLPLDFQRAGKSMAKNPTHPAQPSLRL